MSLVIPTRQREELPDDFAYTLWPSRISDLLAETPQREDAELVFHWRDEFWASHWRERIRQKGVIKLLDVHYTPEYSPYFPKWKITIYSVPKEYLTAAQEILFGGALDGLVDKLKSIGDTPTYDVHEVIRMNLAEVAHDASRLSEAQLATPAETNKPIETTPQLTA